MNKIKSTSTHVRDLRPVPIFVLSFCELIVCQCVWQCSRAAWALSHAGLMQPRACIARVNGDRGARCAPLSLFLFRCAWRLLPRARSLCAPYIGAYSRRGPASVFFFSLHTEDGTLPVLAFAPLRLVSGLCICASALLSLPVLGIST